MYHSSVKRFVPGASALLVLASLASGHDVGEASPPPAAAPSAASGASARRTAMRVNDSGPPSPAPSGMAWIPGGEYTMGCDDATMKCTAPKADGATCASDSECVSNNCDATANTCVTPPICI